MIPALLTKFFGARALKAVVAGIVTSGTAGVFTNGFTEGLAPAAHDLGLQIGLWVGSFIIGWLPVYRVPNKPDPKK